VPDDDLRDTDSLWRDIFRETSPIMGLSVLLGAVAGLVLGNYLFHDGMRGGAVFIGLLTVVGFLVGAACGSLLDFLWTKLRGPGARRKKRRRKKRGP
jgi:hypothetical protein